jgi:hypothetical protein
MATQTKHLNRTALLAYEARRDAVAKAHPERTAATIWVDGERYECRICGATLIYATDGWGHP